MNALKKTKIILENFLGIDRLTSKFLGFSRSHLCFMIATNIHSVFVNILLLRQADDVKVTIYYNMICFLLGGFVMVAAGALSKKISLKAIAHIGIGFYVAAYVIFLVFMEDVSKYFVLIAVLMGLGAGFYWLTYFVSLSAYSTDETRDVSISFLGVLGSTISLIVPAVAGAVIGAFEGFTGYEIMFFCAFIFSGISIYLFAKLPKTEQPTGKTHYRKCIHQLVHNKCWRYVAIQVFTRSMREGIFMFFLNVLLFKYVPSEALIGFNALWVGFVAIFAQSFCGKISKPSNRIRIMSIAVTILLITSALLYIQLNTITVLLLSTVNAFFVVLLMNPASSIDFLVIQAMPDGFECRTEYLALFDVCRSVGRFCGLIVLLCMPETPFGYVTAMVAMTLFQYVTVVCAKKAATNVSEYAKSQDNSPT